MIESMRKKVAFKFHTKLDPTKTEYRFQIFEKDSRNTPET